MGTRLAINKHAMLPDGRMFVESRGEEKYFETVSSFFFHFRVFFLSHLSFLSFFLLPLNL